MDRGLRAYLATQVRRARPVLFTGAGFSLGAFDARGERLPSLTKLHSELWDLCFPGQVFEEASSLAYLVDSALIRHRAALSDLLVRRLTVDANSLPDWYEGYFSVPWHRGYTLNIDDVESAAARKFVLPRRVVTVSATASVPQRPAGPDLPGDLEFVHLNGTLADVPDGVTFSITQYAQRLAGNEPWYVRLVADLATRPFVFVGSQLDESPLWQHLAMREHRGIRGLRERRPKSVLVTPTLDIARRALLADYNISWLAMTAEEFEHEVLRALKADSGAGLRFVGEEAGCPRGGRGRLQRVADILTAPEGESEFLLGAEPEWRDIRGDNSIVRAIDEQLVEAVEKAIAAKAANVMVLTGTAASGKSASLMRLCANLSARGREVGWVDRDSELLPREIDEAMRAPDAPTVLAIDDADLIGGDLSPVAGSIARAPACPVVILALRAGKVDQYLSEARLGDVTVHEFGMPLLDDSDINALIALLDRRNRLGVLKGMDQASRRAVFREKAGRQLVVAMIEATSGRRFEEKILEELDDLAQRPQQIYSIVAMATSARYSIRSDEILIALNEASNDAVNDIDALLRRGLLVRGGEERSLRTRHRQIADVIVESLAQRGDLLPVLEGLLLVAATKVAPQLHRSARPWRFLKVIINHEFLLRVLGLEQARNLYGGGQDVLHWDYHFWLQRGTMEAKAGDLALAENFLGQARALAPNDPLVQTEWAYLLFKKAIASPRAPASDDIVLEATTILHELIANRGTTDSYPYHVLGSQTLNWARAGLSSRDEKVALLKSTLARVEEGLRRHPARRELEELRVDVQKSLLLLAVPPS